MELTEQMQKDLAERLQKRLGPERAAVALSLADLAREIGREDLGDYRDGVAAVLFALASAVEAGDDVLEEFSLYAGRVAVKCLMRRIERAQP